jgi:hypothetical protein
MHRHGAAGRLMSKGTKKKASHAASFSGLLGALKTFAADLKEKFALPGSASPEDQLKGPIGELAKSAGSTFGLTVSTKTEAHLSEHSVRPDVAVYSAGLICGYIELKQPGLGADAPKLKGKNMGDLATEVTSTHCREKRERSECTARLNWFTTSSP